MRMGEAEMPPGLLADPSVLLIYHLPSATPATTGGRRRAEAQSVGEYAERIFVGVGGAPGGIETVVGGQDALPGDDSVTETLCFGA